jgi:hypothetical protein
LNYYNHDIHKGLKKFTQIILSALFLFNSIGYIFAYYQLGYIFKQEAIYKINHKNWTGEVTIIEDSPTVEKMDNNEIKFKGMNYDIIKEEIRNGRIIFYCLSDEQENNLYKVLMNHVENNTGSTSSTPVKNILNNIFSDVLIPKTNSAIAEYTNMEYSVHKLIYYKLPDIIIFTPPPQVT